MILDFSGGYYSNEWFYNNGVSMIKSITELSTIEITMIISVFMLINIVIAIIGNKIAKNTDQMPIDDKFKVKIFIFGFLAALCMEIIMGVTILILALSMVVISS